MQTYSDNKYIYSVDMMFAYLYLHKPHYQKIKVSDLINNLNYNCWGDPINHVYHTPNDVINSPTKYESDYKRIKGADLSYPIIITHDMFVIDGMHRLTKSHLEGKKTIKAYVFDNHLLRKFKLANRTEWGKVDKIKSYQLIILFNKKFNT